MAIEITEFANVSISVAPTGVAGGNFGILGFLSVESDAIVSEGGRPILPAERTRSYTSLAGVGEDFEATSETYKAATAFYAQTPTPTDFVAMMCYETAQPGTIVGGSVASEEDLRTTYAGAASGGGLTLTIDNTEVTITDLDLSGDADYTAMAANLTSLVDAQATGAVVNWNGYQFVVIGGQSGTGSISEAAHSDDGNAADDLGLVAHKAKVSNGIAAEAPVEALAVIESEGHEFVGLVTHKKWRDTYPSTGNADTAVDIGVWAEAAKKIFCNTTNDATVLTNSHTGIGKYMKDNTLRFTLTTFSRNRDAYPSASVFGRAASVNFSAVGSTITLNLKQMPGISAEDLTAGEFDNMRANYVSAVVQIGKTVNAFTDSRMASGSWLDTTHGLLWLENRCEVDMFNLLYVNNTKIPYTQVGINTAAAVLERSLAAAVRNGLAAPGFLPDGTYLPEGFIVESVPLADTPSGDKTNRIYKGLSFKMVGAGALHEVEVSGQFSE